MKSTKQKLYISVCIIVFLIVGAFGCSTNEKKIQPTTSSEKALKYFNKGVSLADRLRNEEAAKYFEKAIELDSMFAYARLFLAGTYLSPKDQLDEINQASQMTDHISEGERILIEMAVIGNAGNIDKQLEQIHRAIELYPDDERLYNLIGNIYFGNQEYEKAIEYYNKALDINSDFSAVYNQLGYVYRFLKDYESSEEMFNTYIEFIPNDPNPYDSYAELLMEMGQFEESIEYYEKALSINPYFYFSRTGIASNLNLLEQHTEARNQLQLLYSTATIDGQKQVALTSMAISYIDEGNYKSAIKMLNKRSELNIAKNDTLAIFNDYLQLAFTHSEGGNHEKARELLSTVLILLETADLPQVLLDNGYLNYLSVSSIVALNTNNIPRVKEEILKFDAVEIPEENAAFIRLRNQSKGMLLHAEGNFDEALEKLRQSNLFNPYNLYRIGNIFESKQEIDSALSYYNRAANARLKDSFQYAYSRKKTLSKLSELGQN
jgi:tetratricopeptide (TPR) repeat protein